MLADTSVLQRVARNHQVAEQIAELRRAGRLWTCDIVTLELGYSARHRAEWEAVRVAQAQLAQAPITADTIARAGAVQGELSRTGTHRIKLPDLVIAAAAEAVGVPVLHYDGDYEAIAAVTGQQTQWVATRGSID